MSHVDNFVKALTRHAASADTLADALRRTRQEVPVAYATVAEAVAAAVKPAQENLSFEGITNEAEARKIHEARVKAAS